MTRPAVQQAIDRNRKVIPLGLLPSRPNNRKNTLRLIVNSSWFHMPKHDEDHRMPTDNRIKSALLTIRSIEPQGMVLSPLRLMAQSPAWANIGFVVPAKLLWTESLVHTHTKPFKQEIQQLHGAGILIRKDCSESVTSTYTIQLIPNLREMNEWITWNTPRILNIRIKPKELQGALSQTHLRQYTFVDKRMGSRTNPTCFQIRTWLIRNHFPSLTTCLHNKGKGTMIIRTIMKTPRQISQLQYKDETLLHKGAKSMPKRYQCTATKVKQSWLKRPRKVQNQQPNHSPTPNTLKLGPRMRRMHHILTQTPNRIRQWVRHTTVNCKIDYFARQPATTMDCIQTNEHRVWIQYHFA